MQNAHFQPLLRDEQQLFPVATPQPSTCAALPISGMKKKFTTFNDRIIAERLEPRVLFSADPLGLAVGALLLDDQDSYDSPVSFEPFSEINIGAPDADHAPAPVELIFIDIRADSSREDIQAILAQDRGNAIVHVIDSQTGGIASISTIIAQHDAVSSVHFLVHGDNQGLRIGADWLDIDSIDGFKHQLSSWDQYLTDDADVLLYGCDLTAGTDGLSLIEQLATITGADVAASDNTTGHADRGGDWELETTTGAIETKSLGTERMQQEWNGSLDLIVVTTKDDVVDMDVAATPAQLNDSVVNHKGADGLISLREAIIAANNTVGADEIMLDSEIYRLTLGVYGDTEDFAQTGDLDIREDIVISGATSGGTIIDGNDDDRIFDIFDDQTVLIQNLELRDGEISEPDNGDGHGAGAAIRIYSGDTTLDNVTIRNNETTTGSGGAIWVKSGDLTIENSLIYGNEAVLDGGAIDIHYDDATLTITNSEIYNNLAGEDGGGIAAHHGTNVTISNSYIHHNEATSNGGGLFLETNGNINPTKGLVIVASSTFANNEANNGAGAFLYSNNADIDGTTFSSNYAAESGGGLMVLSGFATIDHSTFTDNEADNDGLDAGDAIFVDIVNGPTSLTIGSSIIADNSNESRPEISGPVISSGFNLIEDPIVGIDHFSDIQTSDSGLNPNLNSVGSNPPTHELNNDSPAISAGGTRPGGVDANNVSPNLFSDIGAVEHESGGTPDQMLFWADHDGWIYRANADGTDQPQRIFQTDIANDMRPFDIEYDSVSNRVYWSETDGVFGRLRSIDVNGGDLKQTPISTFSLGAGATGNVMSPHGIAIDSSDPNSIFLYVAADASAGDNSYLGINDVVRFAVSPDGDLTYDGVLLSGGTITNPQMSNLIDLEYVANLDGREVLIWSDAGNGGSVDQQIIIFDLTPGSTINPIPPTVGTGYNASGLTVDPATGVLYIPGAGVVDYVDTLTFDLDVPESAGTPAHLFNPDITGVQFDTDTLWWTDPTNGIIGNADEALNSSDTVYTYSGKPVAIAVADVPELNTQPVVTNNGITIVDHGLTEGVNTIIDTSMLSATDNNSLADDIVFTLVSIPTEGDLFLDGGLLAVGEKFTQEDISLNRLRYDHYGDEGLEDGFTFTVKEPKNDSSADYFFSISLVGINETTPVANADTIVVDEGGTATTIFNPLADPLDPPILSVTENDTDDDEGDTMTVAFGAATTSDVAYTLLGDGSYDTPHGNIKLAANGTFLYTHFGGEASADSFTYIVTDALPEGNTSNEVTVTIAVNPVNDLPVGVADTINVFEGTPFTADVLANDTDEDGNALTAVLDTGPTHGTVTLNADNTFTYSYNGSAETSDSFTYFANDGTGNSAATTVTINITGTNDLPVGVADTINVFEGTPFTADVLNNDTDEDGDTLSAVLDTGPTHGTVALNADNTFTYSYNGSAETSDSFTYFANDGTGNSAATTVTINITGTNDLPVGVADTINVFEGTPFTADVLANDTDEDGNALTAVLDTGPTHGTVTLNADNTFTYEYNGSAETSDSFTYFANDGTGNSASTTVTVNITGTNDLPVGVADTVNVFEGTPFTADVLSNDTDEDGDTLSAVLDTGPTHGTVTLNADNTFTYEYNGSAETSDSFTYFANDGTGNSAATTVTINITGTNDLPVGVVDTINVFEGTPFTADVLANDTDEDGNALTAVLDTGPTHGTVTLNADNTFTYQYNGSAETSDSFTYFANDGTGNSAATTVTINITGTNDLPVGVADTINVFEGTPFTADVLANDTDEDGNALTAVLDTGPTHGTVTLNADNTFTYEYNGSAETSDSFTYFANDGTGNSASTTVTVNITGTNDLPIGVADTINVFEGTPFTADVLNNDNDEDGDTLSAVLDTGPTHGTVTLNADNTFTYEYNGSAETSDSFTYFANDGTGNSAATTVTINITGTNDLPVGVADTINVFEGTPFTADVLANDTDEDGNALTAVLDTGPTHGTVTLNADNTFTYEYNGSAETSDSFTYFVSDGSGNSLPTTVTINIAGVNDAPQVVDDNFATLEGQPFTGIVLSNDTDEDGDTLNPSTVTGPTFGALVWNANGTFTYAHNGTENFIDSFTYIVTDGVTTSTEATVTIDVTPVNDAPNAVNDFDNVDEGELSSKLPGNVSSILDNDSDPENEKLTASIVEGPSHGILSLDPDTGRFIYQHNGSETTEDTYTYAATDASGASSKATVTISVKEINDDPETEDDEYTVSEGGLLAHSTASVLDNDTDAENEALKAELVGAGPINAESFELFANGTFSYQHNGSETTTDSFTYIAKDTRTGVSKVTTVNIIISEFNDTPIAVEDAYNVDEGELLNHPTASVLDNDSDAENDDLTVELVNGPSNSTAFSLLANGRFSYQHDGSETTEDAFTYVTIDQNNVSSEVEVVITINPINDIPEPQSPEATELNVPLTGELTLSENLFIDAEREPLVYSVIEHKDENDITLPGLPGWLEFKPEQSSFTVTDQESATNIAVVIVATDPNNGTSEQKTIVLSFAPRLSAATTDEVVAPEPVTNTPVVEEITDEPAEPETTPEASLPASISTAEIGITEAINFEHIDIASLIKPLPAIAAEGASSTAEFLANLAANVVDDAVQTNNIEQLAFEFITTESFNRGLDSLADSFDEQKELLEEAYNQSRNAIGRSITLTSGLSVGYLIWLIRGGTLMGSVLSSMPAWRLVDPLPILGSLGDDFDDSGDSLASMVENTDAK